MEKNGKHYCETCSKECIPSGITTGYGVDSAGKEHCFDCCGIQDRERMLSEGKAMFYLTKEEGKDYVSNWPGTLKFFAFHVRKGHHNIARTRYDAYFVGPDKHVWYGVQYGDNTQIIHCKRTKKLWAH